MRINQKNNAMLTPFALRKRDGQTITLGYDNLNRLISRSYLDSTLNIGFAYDLLSHPTAARYINGTYDINYFYDNAGRQTSTTAGGRTLSYQYDAAGNRTRTTWAEATPFYVTTS